MPTVTQPDTLQAELLHACPQTTLNGQTITAEPANLAELSATLRLAGEQGIAVTPTGNGTKQHWYPSPPADAITLRTTRLHRVLDHPWQDMTCTVEAGCRWSDLQHTLARHGQRVALDPLWPESATVGGVVSANDSGALRLRYGGLRDLVLGMTVVLADGTVARTGGRVVKNVAGYDLPKLLTGAEGTLAVLAEITFRLHAIPRHRTSFTVTSADATDLGRLAAALLTSTLSLEALQLRTTPSGFALDCELASTPAVLERQTQQLASFAAGLKLTSAGPSVWQSRQNLFDRLAPDHIAFKATSTPIGVMPLLVAIAQLGGQAVAQSHGILFGALPSSLAAAEIGHLRSLAASLTLLAAELPAGWDRHGPLPSAFAVMQSIKHHFDPRRTLNPGRFLGGL